VDCFDKLADVVEKYVFKKDPLYVEGSWVTDEWEKNGVKYSRVKVRAAHINFLRGKDGGSAGGNGGQSRSSQSARASQPEYSDAAEDFPFEEDFPLDFDSLPGGGDADVPF
jgi:single-stranded DNA-binding protein